MALLAHRYHRLLVVLKRSEPSMGSVFYIIRYLHVGIAITGLVTWETAVVTIPLILNLCAIWIIEMFVRSRPELMNNRLQPNAALITV